MVWLRLAPLLLLAAVFATPPPTEEQYELAAAGRSMQEARRSAPLLPSIHVRSLYLKKKYVAHNCGITSAKGGYPQVEVDATYGVSDYAHQIAATTVCNMLKHMSSYLFGLVASRTKVGLFTKAEKLTVFPEFAQYRNTASCGASCAGGCKITCAAHDDRKFEDLPGVGGARAVVIAENVLCSAGDPYHSQSNILVHEYCHSIMDHALPQSYVQRIKTAYSNARARRTWTREYEMNDEHEYFCEAVTSFMNGQHMAHSTGGMNQCGGSLCSSEAAMRYNIYSHDPDLYNIIANVFTNNKVNALSGIRPCP